MKEALKDIKDVVTNLCYFDTRNTDGVVSNLTADEVKEEGWTSKARKDCTCDNCFYGRTVLAEYILKLESDFERYIHNKNLNEGYDL
jgi:hypothetical protein